MLTTLKSSCIASFLTLGLLAHIPANAQHFTQTNLVSDTGIGGTKTDPNLKNVWGLSRSTGGPWWVSNNNSNTSTLYGADGTKIPLTVAVPGGPTGTVFNYTTDFVLGAGPAVFMFAAEDGSISAWNGGPAATVVAMKKSGVYKGLALASFEGANYLYAANFHSGEVDILDHNFHYVAFHRYDICESENCTDDRHDGDRYRDAFSLGQRWSGFAAFNVQNLGGTIFVSYAKQDAAKHDNLKGSGLGIVAAFTTGGKLIHVFEHGPWLNAPWGLALAPSDFGPFSHQLLVGNFGSGQIAAYNIVTGKFTGLLLDAAGKPISIDGLWGLSFGNGAKAGLLNTLYFGAGPNEEQNGLFGTLTSLDATEGNSN